MQHGLLACFLEGAAVPKTEDRVIEASDASTATYLQLEMLVYFIICYFFGS